jgi:hypothetical protein
VHNDLEDGDRELLARDATTEALLRCRYSVGKRHPSDNATIAALVGECLEGEEDQT